MRITRLAGDGSPLETTVTPTILKRRFISKQLCTGLVP
ncbi:hypothetical protein AGR2A_pa40035 [Agrobacterium genomosp. 2 str. CFBP 5494]|uniref:Uncharacterized protein n=1 Tax=Agrobacterium genomosp. 2 str. CFBP 5494 TaxID=1183436 RepID=A0A9W5B6K4_9HYPH|nr:hypothetical protein AGR2A_pa40035 [Agrobacterium genomosp. 2 str. CFBP 5494]